MHVVFIPYGRRDAVERFLREMEAQKHLHTFRKGKEVKGIYLQGSIRTLPFGIVEYIFPKEDLDNVLNTLQFDTNRYSVSKAITTLLRELTKCKKIPKYKKENRYLWIQDNVSLIPIGIREDIDIEVTTESEWKGWTHEAL